MEEEEPRFIPVDQLMETLHTSQQVSLLKRLNHEGHPMAPMRWCGRKR
jgi:hypothetical protein